jgi:hypothetical protein
MKRRRATPEIAKVRSAERRSTPKSQAKNAKKRIPKKAPTSSKRKRVPELTEEELEIAIKASCYCFDHFPWLWTIGSVPEERVGDDGSRQWTIQVYLRYPTGFDGYLGDILYDGKEFTELTDRETMRERAKKIAADPERLRQWNEFRASTLPAAKR